MEGGREGGREERNQEGNSCPMSPEEGGHLLEVLPAISSLYEERRCKNTFPSLKPHLERLVAGSFMMLHSRISPNSSKTSVSLSEGEKTEEAQVGNCVSESGRRDLQEPLCLYDSLEQDCSYVYTGSSKASGKERHTYILPQFQVGAGKRVWNSHLCEIQSHSTHWYARCVSAMTTQLNLNRGDVLEHFSSYLLHLFS